MRKDPKKVYTTHGDKPQPIGVRAIIDGVRCIAYMKDEKVISYEPWEDFQKQMLMGPCVEIKTANA